MKLSATMLLLMTALLLGAIGGWFSSRQLSDRNCGLMLLGEIKSNSEQQIATYERMREMLSSGDNAKLSKYLQDTMEMEKLALKSSEVAGKK